MLILSRSLTILAFLLLGLCLIGLTRHLVVLGGHEGPKVIFVSVTDIDPDSNYVRWLVDGAKSNKFTLALEGLPFNNRTIDNVFGLEDDFAATLVNTLYALHLLSRNPSDHRLQSLLVSLDKAAQMNSNSSAVLVKTPLAKLAPWDQAQTLRETAYYLLESAAARPLDSRLIQRFLQNSSSLQMANDVLNHVGIRYRSQKFASVLSQIRAHSFARGLDLVVVVNPYHFKDLQHFFGSQHLYLTAAVGRKILEEKAL